MTSVAALADAVRAAEPRLGSVRLVCVEGPAGSGKTTLANLLGAELDGTVLHLDDLYDGWAGLDGVFERLDEQVLTPLGLGRRGSYQRYDWELARFADWREVPVPAFLVVEGCGSAPRALDGRAVLVVWVEAPVDVRLGRGLARDGETMRENWLRWLDLEAAHFAREGTRERADVVVDGRTALQP
ncbi:uridine kinase [Cellulomonas sp. KRMCY2]|uniref:uridine kinase family protein n=1 Tax=Cellulomonas sp. KRMCY2 TaxID=1304865 RepID=UPI001E4DD324|nr:uridine kinase [Cellulomonas sp. KRMCY2]